MYAVKLYFKFLLQPAIYYPNKTFKPAQHLLGIDEQRLFIIPAGNIFVDRNRAIVRHAGKVS